MSHCKLCDIAYKLGRNIIITLEQYDKLHKAQNGVCAICGGVNKDGSRLAVDHNHNANEIRGLLCRNCNLGLGLFRDSIIQFQSAINYLRNYLTKEKEGRP